MTWVIVFSFLLQRNLGYGVYALIEAEHKFQFVGTAAECVARAQFLAETIPLNAKVLVKLARDDAKPEDIEFSGDMACVLNA